MMPPSTLAEQTREVGFRAGTNPFFLGFPDPPELELETQWRDRGVARFSPAQSVDENLGTSRNTATRAVKCGLRLRSGDGLSARGRAWRVTCRVHGDRLRLSPVAVVGALSSSLPLAIVCDDLEAAAVGPRSDQAVVGGGDLPMSSGV